MTIVEQLNAVAAERDTLKAAIDLANATVAKLTEQAATLGKELESAQLAIAERDTLAVRIAETESARAESDKALADAVARAEKAEAALKLAPEAFDHISEGRTPVKNAGDATATDMTWEHAEKALGYVEARRKHPEAYAQYMKTARLTHKG